MTNDAAEEGGEPGTGDKYIKNYTLNESPYEADLRAALVASGVAATDIKGTAMEYVAANFSNLNSTKRSDAWAGTLRDFVTKLVQQTNIKTAIASGSAFTPVTDNKKQQTLADVDAGLYLIVDTTENTAGGKTVAIPMVVGTGIGDVSKVFSHLSRTGEDATAGALNTVEWKGNTTGETIDKKVTGGGADNANAAQIGDTLTYTVTTKVPNWTGYDVFQLRVVDFLSKGLTWDDITSVKVNNVDMQKDTDYKVTTSSVTSADAHNGKTKVVFEFAPVTGQNYTSNILVDDTTKAKYPVDAAIEIVYTVKLNKDALVGDANTNDVRLVHSNDPNTASDGKVNGGDNPGDTPDPEDPDNPDNPITPTDPPKTYTGEIQMKKTKMDGSDLAGAKFKLYKAASVDATKIVKFVAVDAAAGKYRVADAAEIAAGGATLLDTVTTGTGGALHITGLSGTYTLQETESPLGSAAILPTFQVTVTVSTADTAPADGRSAVTTSGDIHNLVVTDTNTNDAAFSLRNAANLLDMPKTGASWMAIYAGVALLTAGGAAFVLARARRQARA